MRSMKKIVKLIIKSLFDVVFLVLVLPLYLVYALSFFNVRCFTGIAEFLSLFPGIVGYFLRKAFYGLTMRTGKGFDAGFGTILQYPSIKVGDNVYIGQNSNIAKCTICSGVKIGSSVHVVNKDTHAIGEEGDILPTDVSGLKRVVIGANTWIGNNSIVMADVGKNCIIGAGSVIVKPIPDGSVAVGNPAKVIRKRKS